MVKVAYETISTWFPLRVRESFWTTGSVSLVVINLFWFHFPSGVKCDDLHFSKKIDQFTKKMTVFEILAPRFFIVVL